MPVWIQAKARAKQEPNEAKEEKRSLPSGAERVSIV